MITKVMINNGKTGRPSQRPSEEVIYYLSEVRGLTSFEIARIAGVSPSTVRVWKTLIRKGEYKC